MFADIWPGVILFVVVVVKTQWKKKYSEEEIIEAIDSYDVDAVRRMIYSPVLRDHTTLEKLISYVYDKINQLNNQPDDTKEVTIESIIERLTFKKNREGHIKNLSMILLFLFERGDWRSFLKMTLNDLRSGDYFGDFFGNMTEEDWERLRKEDDEFRRRLEEQRKREDERLRVILEDRNSYKQMLQREHPTNYENYFY